MDLLTQLSKLAARFKGFLGFCAFLILAAVGIFLWLFSKGSFDSLTQNFTRLDKTQFFSIVIVVLVLLFLAFLVLIFLAYKSSFSSPEPPKPTQFDRPSPARGETALKGAQPYIQTLVTQLLSSDLQKRFECSDLSALTDDDEAGLSLIAELIDKRAERLVCVIGRGPQLVDSRSRRYLEAVANAIVRGVQYKRILLLDSSLPQNGLLWLLLLERFLGSAKWRDSVDLYVVRMESTNLALQFQVIDDKYLHVAGRSYPQGDDGASKKAQSQFVMAPSREVLQHCELFQARLSQAGTRYNHAQIVELLSEILHDFDRTQQHLTYHWQLVLNVIELLDQLDIPEMPSRSIRFVGSLMPFTFTYKAAEQFVKSVDESDIPIVERVVVLPFRRLDDAIQQFTAGRLDFVCVPVENSEIDNLIPPTLSESRLNLLKQDSQKVYEKEVPVRLALAGLPGKPGQWRTLVAVEAAYKQVAEGLPKNASRLSRYDEEVESNYHAACIAHTDSTFIAITTYEAAKHFNLNVYSDLHPGSQHNTTKFAVFAHMFPRVH